MLSILLLLHDLLSQVIMTFCSSLLLLNPFKTQLQRSSFSLLVFHWISLFHCLKYKLLLTAFKVLLNLTLPSFLSFIPYSTLDLKSFLLTMLSFIVHSSNFLSDSITFCTSSPSCIGEEFSKKTPKLYSVLTFKNPP